MFASYRLLFDPLLRATRETVPAFAGLQAGQRVLDVCCGTGAQAYVYARHGLIATGLDLSPDMLRQAVYYQRQASFTTILGDAAHLPFTDGSFDAASISLALHDKEAALQQDILREMRRVVRRGGQLILLDYARPLPRSLVGTLICLMEWVAGSANRHSFQGYLWAGGLPALLTQAGLRPAGERQAGAGTLLLVRCAVDVCQEPPSS